MSDDPTPDQTLPEDLEDQEVDEEGKPVAPNQDLPSEKQPPRGPGNSRGRSEEAREQAPGQNKP